MTHIKYITKKRKMIKFEISDKLQKSLSQVKYKFVLHID